MTEENQRKETGSRHGRPSRWWVPCVVTLCLVVVAIAVHRRLRRSPKDLQSDSFEYDFGMLRPGTATHLQHTFVLTNHTNVAIAVTDVKTSCGCTTAFLGDRTIKPGAAVSLLVQAKWTGRVGAQSAQVFIRTNAPDSDDSIFTIRGTIRNEIMASPARIELGTLASGSVVSRIVDISSTTEDDRVQVLGVRSTLPLVNVERIPLDDRKGTALVGPLGRFKITVMAKRSSVPVQSEVVFDTSSTLFPHVPVAISFAGEPSISPNTLVFVANTELSVVPPQESKLRVVTEERGCVVRLGHNSISDGAFFVKRPWFENVGGVVEVPVLFDAQAATTSFSFGKLEVTAGGESWTIPLLGIRPARGSASASVRTERRARS